MNKCGPGKFLKAGYSSNLIIAIQISNRHQSKTSVLLRILKNPYKYVSPFCRLRSTTFQESKVIDRFPESFTSVVTPDIFFPQFLPCFTPVYRARFEL